MEPFIGQIVLFAGDFAMRGWAPCDGRLMSITQHSAVFSILLTRYGGDGITTFALPKLDKVGDATYLIALQGVFPSRSA